jgi:hypothetical protein
MSNKPYSQDTPSLLDWEGHREAFVVYPEGVRHRSGLSIPSEDVCKEIALQLLKRSQFAHALERATEEGWKW